ncbi:MAG: hypothetical protein J3Q66DRAFT_342972 [Benniella sp.]|nr:MAG: hypothetical protein J3Q66DRAFT_342972 [Benniella sp.]
MMMMGGIFLCLSDADTSSRWILLCMLVLLLCMLVLLHVCARACGACAFVLPMTSKTLPSLLLVALLL